MLFAAGVAPFLHLEAQAGVQPTKVERQWGAGEVVGETVAL